MMQSNMQAGRPPQASQQRNTLIVVAIIGVAVIAAGVAILLAMNPTTVTPGDYKGMPFSRQPDGGFLLGNPDARVTVIEWADYA